MNFTGMTPQEIADEIIRARDSQYLHAPQADVCAFMRAFGQAIPKRPQWPDQQTMDLRVRLVAEEFCEWLRDSGYEGNMWVARYEGTIPGYGGQREIFSWLYEPDTQDTIGSRSLPKSADALIDLLYVTIGTLSAMGINMWPLWDEAQRANMAKTGGPVVNGKQMKPEGWTPPDVEGELRKQGWEGEDA